MLRAMPFSLFLALKYLKPKRSFTVVVTMISVLGVLLGVSILVIVLSVMTGFDEMWREKILSFKPHLMVTSPTGVIEDPEAVCQVLEAIPGVLGVSPSIETRVLLQYDRRMTAPLLIGIDPDRAGSVSQVGSNMVAGAYDVSGDALVMGVDQIMELGTMLGDTVLVYSPLNVISMDEIHLPEELELRGVFNMGMRDFDSGIVLTSLGVARDLVGLERGAYSIHVMTDNPFRFAEYTAAVKEALGPFYRVRSWQEIDQVIFAALSHEKNMMFILLVFITIVAIFCVTNTLIVITVQKTHEIGLLKALGFSFGQILGAFVWHGWIQCLIGTVLGIGTGLLVLNNLKGIVRVLTSFNVHVFPKAIYGLAEIPWKITATEIFQISAVVMLFCTLASLLPAWRAARMDPVEALRHE